jgi:glutamate/tyrosine decarboxylase-like PLP-dependent enzyme
LRACRRDRSARDESATPIRAALDLTRALPESGTDPAALLRKTAAELFAHSLFNQHPRFFGYITAPPAPIGVLGDLLASALNPNVSSWRLAPAATEIELQTVRWIAEFIGFRHRRRAAGERRQHGELRLLLRGARREDAVEDSGNRHGGR